MLSIEAVEQTFLRGISRARTNIALFSHLKASAPAAMSCDDMLRGAVVIASSAFDLLNHQAYRVLCLARISDSKFSMQLSITTTMLHQPLQHSLPVIDATIKQSLSHRSFLQPDKIAELYSPIIDGFWNKVCVKHVLDEKSLKSRIRYLGQWRNRIVHESDINPDLAGIEEWPIYFGDTKNCVDDYQTIGHAICSAIKECI